MMRYAFVAMIALGAIMVAGCVPSLHPLFTDDDLVADSTLVGAWVSENGNETWEFYEADGKSYELTYTQDESPAHFMAHLVSFDGRLFMDTYPDEEIENDFYKLHLVPAHVFGRVSLSQDTLKMSLLEADWLKGVLDKGEIKLAHEMVEGSLVLTASTEELQRFVRKYADDPEAFAEPNILTRRK